MKNKELNVFMEILHENKITTENFNYQTFFDILERMNIKLDYQNYTNNLEDRIHEYIIYKNENSGSVYLNVNYLNQINKNIISLSFPNFYVQILHKIIDNYHFMYHGFTNIFKIIYNLKMYVDENIDMEYVYFDPRNFPDEISFSQLEISGLLNKWLTFVFGSFNNDNIHTIYCDQDIRKDICIEAENVFNDIKKRFKGNIIYYNTNQIYFKYNKKMMDYIEDLNYIGKLNYHDNMMIFGKKKYIIFNEDKNIQINGFATRY